MYFVKRTVCKQVYIDIPRSFMYAKCRLQLGRCFVLRQPTHTIGFRLRFVFDFTHFLAMRLYGGGQRNMAAFLGDHYWTYDSRAT